MKTAYRIREPYADLFLSCARKAPCKSKVRPERFIRIMKRNRGAIAMSTGMGYAPDGLELKNPLIAGIGDSVTAGHFEGLDAIINPKRWVMEILKRAGISRESADLPDFEKDPATAMAKLQKLALSIPDDQGFPPAEITDARESYLEKFRAALIDKYEETSVSVINSGIAGDNLIMMEKRLSRDVIRYQPDLVLINGSLNWSDAMGSTEDYKKILVRMVRRIKDETDADTILLTPNAMVGDPHACGMLKERVIAIRETADEEGVCLADTYAVWEEAKIKGCPYEELLANRINHPSVEGHEVYAIVLMKLFDEE